MGGCVLRKARHGNDIKSSARLLTAGDQRRCVHPLHLFTISVRGESLEKSVISSAKLLAKHIQTSRYPRQTLVSMAVLYMVR